MGKYRIQLLKDGRLRFMNIILSKEKGASIGDRFVKGIHENSDICENVSDIEIYSDPMDINEIEKYVQNRISYLRGPGVGRCLGLSLEDDNNKKIYFQKPVVKK